MAAGRPRTGLEWLRRLDRHLRRLNVEVDLGSPEAAAILALQGGGEGVTVPDKTGATILFRDREPSASVVLEEVAHVLQADQARFADEDARIMIQKREIEARECLIAHRERLGIPPEEDEVSRTQLERHRAELARLEERWR